MYYCNICFHCFSGDQESQHTLRVEEKCKIKIQGTILLHPEFFLGSNGSIIAPTLAPLCITVLGAALSFTAGGSVLISLSLLPGTYLGVQYLTALWASRLFSAGKLRHPEWQNRAGTQSRTFPTHFSVAHRKLCMCLPCAGSDWATSHHSNGMWECIVRCLRVHMRRQLLWPHGWKQRSETHRDPREISNAQMISK